MSGCQVWSRKLGAVSREPQFLLDRRICSLAGELKLFQKGTSLHRRHFPVDFRGEDYTAVPHAPRSVTRVLRFCVAPVWVPGSWTLVRVSPGSLFAALSWVENLPHRPGNLAPASARFAALGELLDRVIPPHCTHFFPLQKRKSCISVRACVF